MDQTALIAATRVELACAVNDMLNVLAYRFRTAPDQERCLARMESLVRWRDRLRAPITVPLLLSAPAALRSAPIEAAPDRPFLTTTAPLR